MKCHTQYVCTWSHTHTQTYIHTMSFSQPFPHHTPPDLCSTQKMTFTHPCHLDENVCVKRAASGGVWVFVCVFACLMYEFVCECMSLSLFDDLFNWEIILQLIKQQQQQQRTHTNWSTCTHTYWSTHTRTHWSTNTHSHLSRCSHLHTNIFIHTHTHTH